MRGFVGVVLAVAGVVAFYWLVNWLATEDTRFRTRIAYQEWKRLAAADSLAAVGRQK